MRLTMRMLVALLLCLIGFSAQAAHTHARLVLARDSAKPGETVLAGVYLQMDEGWHTYWKNSGESGMPTTIEWQLPKGITADPAEWPPPEKMPEQEFTTYVYQGDVMFLVPVKLSANLPPGPLNLKAQVSWLECQLQCLPGKAEVSAVLNIGAESKPSKEEKLLEEWRKKLPLPGEGLHAQARWEAPPHGDARPLLIGWASTQPLTNADFYPDASDSVDIQGPTDQVPAASGNVLIRKQVKKLGAAWPDRISGLLIQDSAGHRQAYTVTLPLGEAATGQSPTQTSLAAPAMPLAGTSVWQMLLYAFIGGLILNIMPCVLPVIALKILGFVGQAKENPGQARRLSLIYALGVIVSFAALAGIVIGVKAAGHKAGWGIQFGNPYFLIAMTTLATLIALNLFGVFEVHLGGRTMGAAAELSARHGAAGAFFNGLLATLLATSCTAPFLGAAVGFAFSPSQTPVITLLVFLTIGIGLALPYVVLTWQPAWLKLLPKPGAWMERFKVAMGFPMLAAAVWLFSLVSLHYGERSWWLMVFLVMVGVAAWIFGEFVQRSRARPALALVAILLILGIGYGSVLEGHLRWREPMSQVSAQAGLVDDSANLHWQPWSPMAVAQARAENRPVLVDFTAKWCLTCNTIVKPALESSSVRKKLQELNAVALIGDYTGFPDNITEELGRFGRAGVPLVLVYPGKTNTAPIILPEALTPGMVVAALDEAAK